MLFFRISVWISDPHILGTSVRFAEILGFEPELGPALNTASNKYQARTAYCICILTKQIKGRSGLILFGTRIKYASLFKPNT